MPVPKPEEVEELLAKLKDARSKVAELESRWESFFTRPEASVVFVPMLNLKPRIIQLLESRPDFSFDTATVAKALDANVNSVGPYLSDLTGEGKIERRDRGLYGALRPDAPNYANQVITDDDIPF
jgi:hypothetical protein